LSNFTPVIIIIIIIIIITITIMTVTVTMTIPTMTVKGTLYSIKALDFHGRDLVFKICCTNFLFLCLHSPLNKGKLCGFMEYQAHSAFSSHGFDWPLVSYGPFLLSPSIQSAVFQHGSLPTV
jgi:hypothetical protein